MLHKTIFHFVYFCFPMRSHQLQSAELRSQSAEATPPILFSMYVLSIKKQWSDGWFITYVYPVWVSFLQDRQDEGSHKGEENIFCSLGCIWSILHWDAAAVVKLNLFTVVSKVILNILHQICSHLLAFNLTLILTSSHSPSQGFSSAPLGHLRVVISKLLLVLRNDTLFL